MQSVASEFQTNSSEELEAHRRRFRQMKHNESLNKQYYDEKHPRAKINDSSRNQSSRQSSNFSADEYGESIDSYIGKTISSDYESDKENSYFDYSIRSSKYFTKRQLAKLKRIVNNFLIYRLRSKMQIQFYKWKRLGGQKTILNQKRERA